MHGEIDLETAPALRVDLDRFAETTDGRTVICCRALALSDSSGIAVFVGTQKELRAQGRELHLVNVRPSTTRVLEVLGLAAGFRLDAALAGERVGVADEETRA